MKDTDAVDLLGTVFKAVLDKTNINPIDIGDIVIGSVLGPSSQRANEARIASFFAGIPEEVPVHTVNRSGPAAELPNCCNMNQPQSITLCICAIVMCMHADHNITASFGCV